MVESSRIMCHFYISWTQYKIPDWLTRFETTRQWFWWVVMQSQAYNELEKHQNSFQSKSTSSNTFQSADWILFIWFQSIFLWIWCIFFSCENKFFYLAISLFADLFCCRTILFWFSLRNRTLQKKRTLPGQKKP